MNYILAALSMACLAGGLPAQSREHAEASIVLRLPAPPAVVFPLFGPVRESEWSPHWNPTLLYPPDHSQKEGAVFTTRKDDGDVVWVLTAYDASAYRIGYVIIAPGRTAGQLDITLKPVGEKETEANVIHRMTALSEGADRDVKNFAAEFPLERAHWEHAISKRLHELSGQ